MTNVSRLDVISTGARRRWTLTEKHRIVAESYDGPRLVSATARRNGLSASQLFTWRRLAREGRLVEGDEATTFAPAVINCEPSTSGPPSSPTRLDGADKLPTCPATVQCRIEIVLTCGRRVIVDPSVDAMALARVVAVLERP
jgi:transposase